MNLALDQRKPFNPVWGETVQYKTKDYDICVEQTLHHPPVLSFYVTNSDKSVQYYGTKDLEAGLWPNSLIGYNLGTEHFEIDGSKYTSLL